MGVGSLLGVSAGLQPVFRRFDSDFLHWLGQTEVTVAAGWLFNDRYGLTPKRPWVGGRILPAVCLVLHYGKIMKLRTIGEMAITSVLHTEVRGSTPLLSTCSQIGQLASRLT